MMFTELVGGDILTGLQAQGHEVRHVERSISISKLKGTASLISTIQAALEQDALSASSPISTNDEVGGIDLDDINVDRQGFGVDIQFDPVEIQSIIDLGIDGFVPVIINLTPLPSVLPLLGLAPKEEEEEFELSQMNS